MEAKKLGRKTRRLLHSILTKMFAYAVDDLELIERNPVKKGLAPKVDKVEKPALREEQLVELFQSCPRKVECVLHDARTDGHSHRRSVGPEMV